MKATRCKVRLGPGGWKQALIYTRQCGNKTKHPSGKCHVHVEPDWDRPPVQRPSWEEIQAKRAE